MKLLAILGLTAVSSMAFGGLVYVVTPHVEDLGVSLPFKSSGTPGGRLVGYYQSRLGGDLRLEADGTYILRVPSDERVEGKWRLQSETVVLEAGLDRRIVLSTSGFGDALTLRGDGLELFRAEYWHPDLFHRDAE